MQAEVRIGASLRGLRYGSVTLIMHEGRLVEIQKTEKIRTGNSQTRVRRYIF